MGFLFDFSRDWALFGTDGSPRDPFSGIRARPFLADVRGHGAEIFQAEPGVPAPDSPVRADGIILWDPPPGASAGIVVADCAAIVFSCADGRALGALHAGWRGAAAGIIRNAAALVRSRLGARAWEEGRFAISPMAVRGYRFGADDFGRLAAPGLRAQGIVPEPFFRADGEGGELDLHGMVVALLRAQGVLAVEPSPADTLDPASPWPSHRLSSRGIPGKSGRLLALASAARGLFSETNSPSARTGI